jgi:hypothetical protein
VHCALAVEDLGLDHAEERVRLRSVARLRAQLAVVRVSEPVEERAELG